MCMELSSFGIESMDTWFGTLYFVYGLGLELQNSFLVRVELRRNFELR